jgi:hypothetical protein
MKKHLIYLLAFGIILLNGCQKELSFETGGSPGEGSLQSDVSGDCLPKSVNGTYIATTALVPATNTITVQVNVTKTGTYVITTDTVNGYYFRGTGTFTTLGATNITLRGNGTPFASGVNNFIVSYGTSVCDIQVTVLPAGAGGPATFTGDCAGITVNGNYVKDVALNSTNTVTLNNINVTAIGTYNITTTFQGMTFAGSGAFLTTGVQSTPITLTGTGTPTTPGTNTVPVTIGSTTCSFPVNVQGPAVFTMTCAGITVNGTYQAGIMLTAANTITIPITVTSAGAYSISATADGMTFSASGNLTVSSTSITLTGSGTPTTSGTFPLTITFGSATCTCNVTVAAAPTPDYFPRTTNSNWSYEFDDTPDDSLLIKVIPNTINAASQTFNIFMQTADVTAGFDTSGYYNKVSNDYNHWVNLADYFSFDNPQWVAFTFLKDNQAANVTWTTPGYTGTIGGTPITVRIKFTVKQKDVPFTLTTSTGTVTYQNTIVIEEHYEAQNGSLWVSLDGAFGFYKDYYSRNIGWLKDEYYFTSTSTPDNIFEMRRYQVF